MADCDDNGHQPLLYLQYCCNLINRGKSFKIQDEMDRINYVLCPSIPPISCPVFSSCSQLHDVYSTAPSGYYNIRLSNGSQVEVYTVIWRVINVMEREVGQEWHLLT